jgi:hypothetical protein
MKMPDAHLAGVSEASDKAISRQNDEEAENRKHGWGTFSDSRNCG